MGNTNASPAMIIVAIVVAVAVVGGLGYYFIGRSGSASEQPAQLPSFIDPVTRRPKQPGMGGSGGSAGTTAPGTAGAPAGQ